MDTPSVAHVTEAMERAGVTHGTIHLHAVQNNFSFTDNEQVFCKVSRSLDSKALSLELKLALHFGPEMMLKPLVSDLLMVDHAFMSVWVYEDLKTLYSAESTTKQARTAAELLTRLHQTKVPEVGLKSLGDFSFLRRKIEVRSTFAEPFGAKVKSLNLLSEIFESMLGQVKFSDTARLILAHGDPHFGNLVTRGRRKELCYIDYESAQLAYREFDIAAVHVYLRILGENPKAWFAAQDRFLQLDSAFDVAAFDLFTIARLISMTSYGLLHPQHYDVFEYRMKLLNDMYSTGKLPSHFPKVI
jgi:hypothetical protein